MGKLLAHLAFVKQLAYDQGMQAATAGQAELAHLMRVATRSLEREMMVAAARAGYDMLRPRHMTLLRVLDPGSAGTRISDLARDADVSRQAIQQVVVELESLGIVEVIRDREDARARLVRYTDYGRGGFVRCMQEFTRIERGYENRLGPRRIAALKRTLVELTEQAQG